MFELIINSFSLFACCRLWNLSSEALGCVEIVHFDNHVSSSHVDEKPYIVCKLNGWNSGLTPILKSIGIMSPKTLSKSPQENPLPNDINLAKTALRIDQNNRKEEQVP